MKVFWIIFTAVIILLGGALYLYFFQGRPVNISDVKITEIKELNSVVTVRWLLLHSSMVVKSITAEKINDKIIIKAYMVPARKKLSGSFTVDVTVFDSKQEIYFNDTKIRSGN